jgi:uncharacterized membrane protein YkvA (DUF1232 family)
VGGREAALARIGERLRRWARALRRDIGALWLAARDPRVPAAARLVAAAVVAYAVSPVDLIPDFVPVLGLLDDLVLLPAGIWLAARLVPPGIMADLRARPDAAPPRAAGLLAAAAVVALWLVLALAGLSQVLG